MGAAIETTTGLAPLLATAIMTAGFAAPFAYVLFRAGRSGPAGFAFLLIVVGVFAFACGVLLNGLSPLLMFGFSWPCVCVGLGLGFLALGAGKRKPDGATRPERPE